MKPISLSFQCFGPYRAPQTIDFSLLEKNGLFLISGETGSGKSTILDAICCALYGEASNKSRGDLEAMRCKQAEKTEETRVEYVFDSGGRRYKFVRVLRCGHKNIIDEHNCLEYRDGVYVPLFENPKKTRVNEKARELIGLTAEQFRQVIVLPQGKFETLLVSDSKEKEEILTSIFHADRWDRIEKYIADAVKRERDALEVQTILMRQTLAGYKCESIEALSQALAEKQLEAQETKQRADALDEDRKTAAKRYTAALMQNEAFTQLDDASARRSRLAQKHGEMQRHREELLDAQRAQKIAAVYEACTAARKNDEKAQRDAADAKNALEKAQRQLVLTQDKLEKHAQARPQYLEQTDTVRKLCDAREAYAAVTGTTEALKRAAAQAERDRQALDARERESAHTQRTLQESSDAFDTADADCRTARERYMRSISGNLAAQALEDGKPCPVCGSTHHPHPAQPPQDGMTQQAFEAVEAQRDRCYRAFRKAREAYETAKSRTDAAKTACAASSLVLQQAQSDERHARSLLIEGVETAEQLEEEIARLQTKINLYEQQENALQDAAQRALAAREAKAELLSAAQSACAQTRKTLASQTDLWEAARVEAGFADTQSFLSAVRQPQQIQTITRSLAEYDAACAAAAQQVESLSEKVRGKTRPDVDAAQAQARAVEEAWNEASQNAAVLADKCEKMRHDCKTLQTQEKERAALQLRLEEDTVFQKRIAGSNGMSLKRYVLGVMLTGVTEQANEILRGVYGGRYSLHRTDASTGGVRRSGLELEVLDRQGNVRRSVKTLSGGEKFLAALSLAIGLSTVVQSRSGGVRLDAMFIDEGFGTLDRNTMQDALDVLQCVQRQSAIVGVISHVEALRENIPAQIEIVKGEDGSRCTIRGV